MSDVDVMTGAGVTSAASEEPALDLGYTVSVDAFSGPLDLLLFLVRKSELDIIDIPVATITDQFVALIVMWQQQGELDLEVAGDFILMAATLIEIKARTIAPPPIDDGEKASEDDEDALDPRADLIGKLLAYRRFKEAVGLLTQLEAQRQQRVLRQTREEIPEDPEEAAGIDLGELDVTQLSKLWNTLLTRIGGGGPRTVMKDEMPIEGSIRKLSARASEEKKIYLRQLFAAEDTLQGRISMLMATLECTRQRIVHSQQLEQYADVELCFREESDRVITVMEFPAEEPGKKRRRRPPLVTYQMAVPLPTDDLDETAEVPEEKHETDEERFVRELNEACDLDGVLARVVDVEKGFQAYWDELHPPVIPALPVVAEVPPVVETLVEPVEVKTPQIVAEAIVAETVVTETKEPLPEAAEAPRAAETAELIATQLTPEVALAAEPAVTPEIIAEVTIPALVQPSEPTAELPPVLVTPEVVPEPVAGVEPAELPVLAAVDAIVAASLAAEVVVPEPVTEEPTAPAASAVEIVASEPIAELIASEITPVAVEPVCTEVPEQPSLMIAAVESVVAEPEPLIHDHVEPMIAEAALETVAETVAEPGAEPGAETASVPLDFEATLSSAQASEVLAFAVSLEPLIQVASAISAESGEVAESSVFGQSVDEVVDEAVGEMVDERLEAGPVTDEPFLNQLAPDAVAEVPVAVTEAAQPLVAESETVTVGESIPGCDELAEIPAEAAVLVTVFAAPPLIAESPAQIEVGVTAAPALAATATVMTSSARRAWSRTLWLSLAGVAGGTLAGWLVSTQLVSTLPLRVMAPRLQLPPLLLSTPVLEIPRTPPSARLLLVAEGPTVQWRMAPVTETSPWPVVVPWSACLPLPALPDSLTAFADAPRFAGLPPAALTLDHAWAWYAGGTWTPPTFPRLVLTVPELAFVEPLAVPSTLAGWFNEPDLRLIPVSVFAETLGWTVLAQPALTAPVSLVVSVPRIVLPFAEDTAPLMDEAEMPPDLETFLFGPDLFGADSFPFGEPTP